MKRRITRWKSTLLATAGLAFLGSLSASPGASASDHLEAPGTGLDPAADIADFFAWHDDGAGTIVVGLAFNALQNGGMAPAYDPDVLYSVHFDTDEDQVSDLDIHCRFGQSPEGDWGIQVTNLPGADVVFEGAVETVLGAGTAQVFAGLRDDPFFFDFDGFIATITTGDLSFDSTNDSFAGTNAHMIVLEFDSAGVSAGAPIRTWVTSGRVNK